jgi:hypothetical protein
MREPVQDQSSTDTEDHDMNLDLTGSPIWARDFHPTHEHRYAPAEVCQLLELTPTEAIVRSPWGTPQRIPYRRFHHLFQPISTTEDIQP